MFVMATEIVLIRSGSGFGLSDVAQKRIKELGYQSNFINMHRHHPILVQVVKELGDDAASEGSYQFKIQTTESKRYLIVFDQFEGEEFLYTEQDFVSVEDLA